MNRTKTLTITIVFLLAAIFVAGCASPSAPPTIQTVPPTTTVPTSLPTMTTLSMTTQNTIVPSASTIAVTVTPAVTSTEKEILHEKGMLTTTTFQTYDFKTLGYKFLYPNDKFRITIKSEKPVLGYAVNSEQALQLQGSTLVPHYESYSKNVQWGLVEASMILEKATDVTEEFTVEEVGPLSYVVDGRWMSFEPIYDGTPPFSYELIITKISGPTTQNFNFG